MKRGVQDNSRKLIEGDDFHMEQDYFRGTCVSWRGGVVLELSDMFLKKLT